MIFSKKETKALLKAFNNSKSPKEEEPTKNLSGFFSL